MQKTFAKIMAALLLITSVCFAGITGKIAGIATDAATGQPLPGVNIVLNGTLMGASSDVDGFSVKCLQN